MFTSCYCHSCLYKMFHIQVMKSLEMDWRNPKWGRRRNLWKQNIKERKNTHFDDMTLKAHFDEFNLILMEVQDVCLKVDDKDAMILMLASILHPMRTWKVF